GDRCRRSLSARSPDACGRAHAPNGLLGHRRFPTPGKRLGAARVTLVQRGTFLPYTAHALTREVAGIQPPGIRSEKPTSSTLEKSGVALVVGMIGTSVGSGFRLLLAFVGVSVMSSVRQWRSCSGYSMFTHDVDSPAPFSLA